MSIASTISSRGTVITASCTNCSSRARPASAELACTVVMPPGWPVFQALSMSSASGPRASPTMMRSGRKRSVERTRSASETMPGLVRSAAPELACVLQDDDALVLGGDLGQQRIDERGLARRCAAGHDDVLALVHG